MNLVVISGRLGQDPEDIKDGWKFSLAVKDIEKVYWIEVLNFNTPKLDIHKGSKVLVKGRFAEVKPKCKIIAERIEFL